MAMAMAMAPGEDEAQVGDIERQFSTASDDQSHSTTSAKLTSKPICKLLYVPITLILKFPFKVAYVISSICLFGKLYYDLDTCLKKPGKPQSIYLQMLNFESPRIKFTHLNIVTITRVGCLALLWLMVNLFVPSLKTETLFHRPLWEWSLFVVIVLLGYPVTLTVGLAFLDIILVLDQAFLEQPNLEYYVDELKFSVISLSHFAAILATWLCYFRTQHGLGPSKRADMLVTWSLVSLLVGAVLWVLKRVILLQWEANAVYKRFKQRILISGFQIFFLTRISTENVYLLNLLPWRKEYVHKKDQKSTMKLSTSITTDEGVKDKTIQDFMLSVTIPVSKIKDVATYVTDLAKVTQRENDGIPEIVTKCQEKIPTQHNGNTLQYLTEKVLRENVGLCHIDAQLLLQKLKEEQMCDQITYDAFHKWMVDAHKNCLSVGYTLIDAFAVVSALDRVMTGFVFVVVIFVWLLATGLATTKVLVIIATQLATFSFVFGDTCKTFFHGVVFSFVTHPYDVGDRCIIDGIEMEVKRINILITTFFKIGTEEEIIYPNASLANMLITNLKGEPDPSDKVELNLDSSTTKSKIDGLKKDLESYFKDPQQKSYDNKIQVLVKGVGSSIKVMITFTHVMNVYDVSHSQCVQRKNKQRSELFLEIVQCLEKREIKFAIS